MIGINEISWEAMGKYYDTFKDAEAGYLVPDGKVVVVNPNTGESYIPYEDETEEKFLDRINRSVKAGRNLFFEEWQENDEQFDPDVEY